MTEEMEYTTAAGVSMRGELARVFDDLFIEAMRKKEVRSRAEFARKLIAAQLRDMGHSVEDNMEWGGSRKEESAAASVA